MYQTTPSQKSVHTACGPTQTSVLHLCIPEVYKRPQTTDDMKQSSWIHLHKHHTICDRIFRVQQLSLNIDCPERQTTTIFHPQPRIPLHSCLEAHNDHFSQNVSKYSLCLQFCMVICLQVNLHFQGNKHIIEAILIHVDTTNNTCQFTTIKSKQELTISKAY